MAGFPYIELPPPTASLLAGRSVARGSALYPSAMPGIESEQSRHMSDLHLILVQHGLARPPAEDAEPELTAEGRRQVERMAAWAAVAGFGIDRIRHSGKLRAAQTAQLLADAVSPPGGVEAILGLKPMDDVGPVAESLGGQTGGGP